jgi:hypothetical protein
VQSKVDAGVAGAATPRRLKLSPAAMRETRKALIAFANVAKEEASSEGETAPAPAPLNSPPDAGAGIGAAAASAAGAASVPFSIGRLNVKPSEGAAAAPAAGGEPKAMSLFSTAKLAARLKKRVKGAGESKTGLSLDNQKVSRCCVCSC